MKKFKLEVDQSYWSQTDDVMVELLNVLFEYYALLEEVLLFTGVDWVEKDATNVKRSGSFRCSSDVYGTEKV